VRKKIAIFILLLIGSASLSSPAHAEDPLLRRAIDPTVPQKAPLVKCQNDVQSDCIERVLIRHANGEVQEARYVTTRLVPFPEEAGQQVTFGDVIFDFNVGLPSGPLRRLRLSTHVITPSATFNGKNAGAYWIMLQREALPSENIVTGGTCTKEFPTACLAYPSLDTQDAFHVYLRTSWLKPLASYGIGLNYNLDYRRTKTGMQWHFSGKEFLQPGFRDPAKLRLSAQSGYESLQPDVLNPSLYFALDHAGKDIQSSYWDPSCADFGFTRTMSVAPLAGQLSWNYDTQSLSLNVYGPHLNELGERNTGAFYTKFQKAWLDCRFPGNTLSTATKITVQVINENGTAQVITSSVGIEEGTIEFWIYGFHFSAPTIKASRAADAGTTPVSQIVYSDDWQKDISMQLKSVASAKSSEASSPTSQTTPSKPKVSVSKSKLTCVKGSKIRKISGASPRCPSGFRKR
jgi:hypothetical protein